MNKLSTILIMSLLLLLLPSSLWGWTMMDDLFFEDLEPEIILQEGSLSLYWSADTYVPFGYQGKRLPTTGSKVSVSAELEILSGNPRSLKYSWFLDDIFQGSKSGYGRDSFQFWATRSKNTSHTILLKVFQENGTFTVEKSITIPITSPELVIYGKDSNQINLPYAASIKDSDVIANKESSFSALPYFFNIKDLKNLEFDWAFADETYKESSLTANVFGLKIINKETEGLLEQTLKVVATNRRQPDQKVLKTVKLNIY